MFTNNIVFRNIKYKYYKCSCNGSIIRNISNSRFQTNQFKKPPWNLLFFGSDEFSLCSLKALFNEYKCDNGTLLKSIDVVSNSSNNPVSKFAQKNKLNISRWPPCLTENEYDIGIVVSFGHLIPKHIIDKFSIGMFNVHASLLPKWRGAAPIIYALANGDTETGVTIMRIKPNHFDIGEILNQEKVAIHDKMEMPELYKTLAELGAQCLLETLYNLDIRLANCMSQYKEGITYAPKIGPQFAQIKWQSATATDVYNLQRALKTIYPLATTWNSIPVKLIGISVCNEKRPHVGPGYVKYDKGRKVLVIECSNETWITVDKVGVQGKKIMTAIDFNNGYLKKQSGAEESYFI